MKVKNKKPKKPITYESLGNRVFISTLLLFLAITQIPKLISFSEWQGNTFNFLIGVAWFYFVFIVPMFFRSWKSGKEDNKTDESNTETIVYENVHEVVIEGETVTIKLESAPESKE